MLDINEEKKYKELRNMCKEMKVIPPPEIMIGLQVHDKDGNLTFDDTQRGHSWTRNFWNAIFGWVSYNLTQDSFGPGYISFKLYNGNLHGYVPAAGIQDGYSHLLSEYHGIMVGSSNTSFDFESYSFGSIIGHGTGTGQLLRSLGTTVSTTYDISTKTWTQIKSRVFNNNSGGTIIVRETGLSLSSTMMAERSVLSPEVTLVDSARLTVNYSISMDFSAID